MRSTYTFVKPSIDSKEPFITTLQEVLPSNTIQSLVYRKQNGKGILKFESSLSVQDVTDLDTAVTAYDATSLTLPVVNQYQHTLAYIVHERKSTGAHGGAGSSNTFVRRAFNVIDTSHTVQHRMTLDATNFTFQFARGLYLLQIWCPTYGPVGKHCLRLRNITQESDDAVSPYFFEKMAYFETRLEVRDANDERAVEHRVSLGHSILDFGLATGQGSHEVFSRMVITVLT